MNKTIFISCGQFTDDEKRLGKQIADLVRKHTDLEPFFADEIQDLSGLDANVLGALRDCVAFITVMHPRGEIQRPDGAVLVRASVWIEQEIAVATYIQRFEGRKLPIIAFRHKSIGREGIRDLLQLNAIEFTENSEVLATLPRHLASWKTLKPSGIELRLRSKAAGQQEGHVIRALETILVNETNHRIETYELEVRLPSGILSHWSGGIAGEVRCEVPGIRVFRFDHSDWGPVRPHDQLHLATFQYCTECAADQHGGDFVAAALISESPLGARVWVNGVEYKSEKTIKQLAAERDEA